MSDATLVTASLKARAILGAIPNSGYPDGDGGVMFPAQVAGQLDTAVAAAQGRIAVLEAALLELAKMADFTQGDHLFGFTDNTEAVLRELLDKGKP